MSWGGGKDREGRSAALNRTRESEGADDALQTRTAPGDRRKSLFLEGLIGLQVRRVSGVLNVLRRKDTMVRPDGYSKEVLVGVGTRFVW